MSSQLFFLFSFIVILGRFADFIIQSHPRSSKNIYIPQKVTFTPYHILWIRYTSEFFDHLFKGRYIAGIGYLHCFLISAFFVQGTVLFSAIFTARPWAVYELHFPALWMVVGLFALILGNFLGDIISIVGTRFLLRSLETTLHTKAAQKKVARNRFAVALFAPLIILFYLSLVVTVMNISFSIILSVRGLATGYFNLLDFGTYGVWAETQWNVLRSETHWRFFDPISEGQRMGIAGSNIIIFCLTPIIAPTLVLLAAVGGFVMDLIDGMTRGRSTAMLGILVNRQQPIFLRISSAIALFGTAAASLITALG